MTKIFISYRRTDSAPYAGRLHDHLEREFGADDIFMDINAIPLGVDFRKHIGDAVGQCVVFIALIGRDWVGAADAQGNRRLDMAGDFVRTEIAAALQRDIPIIPVWLDGVALPDEGKLPADIRDLVFRNGVPIRHETFRSDVERLIRGIAAIREDAADVTEGWSASQPVPPLRQTRDRSGEGRIFIDVPIDRGAPDGWFFPGNGKDEWFQDYEHGPQMVVVPSGEFTKGDGSDMHLTALGSAFTVSRFAITFDEWDLAWSLGGVTHRPEDEGWGRGRRPAINVAWLDAKQYAIWLSELTGETYRLLTDTEWEYVCRAGTVSNFNVGETITKKQAQFSEGEHGVAKQTVGVGSFPSNAWGLCDMHGNVWEWCEDAHNNSARVLRGGSWYNRPEYLRSAARVGIHPDSRRGDVGFRLARTL